MRDKWIAREVAAILFALSACSPPPTDGKGPEVSIPTPIPPPIFSPTILFEAIPAETIFPKKPPTLQPAKTPEINTQFPTPIATPTSEKKGFALRFAPGEIVSRGDPVINKDEIALTLDDTGSPQAFIQTLAFLKEANVQLTFFMQAKYITDIRYLPLVKEAIAQGHEFGVHGYNHEDFSKVKSFEEADEYFAEQTAVYQKALGYRPTLFRFPYGLIGDDTRKIWAKQLLKKYGLIAVEWNVSLGDTGIITESVVERMLSVTKNANSGDIILGHWRVEATKASLKKIAQGVAESGKSIVTITKLLRSQR